MVRRKTLMHYLEGSICYLVSSSLMFHVLWTKHLSVSKLTFSTQCSLSQGCCTIIFHSLKKPNNKHLLFHPSLFVSLTVK